MKLVSVYVYACARDDQFRYAVGAVVIGGSANGSLGLFEQRDHAEMFAKSLAESHGTDYIVLPSVTA